MKPKSDVKIDFLKNDNNRLFDYSQELVMLNYLFELKMISKDEMTIIKQDIEKSYGITNSIIF